MGLAPIASDDLIIRGLTIAYLGLTVSPIGLAPTCPYCFGHTALDRARILFRHGDIRQK